MEDEYARENNYGVEKTVCLYKFNSFKCTASNCSSSRYVYKESARKSAKASSEHIFVFLHFDLKANKRIGRLTNRHISRPASKTVKENTNISFILFIHNLIAFRFLGFKGISYFDFEENLAQVDGILLDVWLIETLFISVILFSF